MLVERVSPVLGQDVDLLDARVEKVGEDEVDDLVFSAEGDAGLGPAQGQRAETLALAAGQHHRNRVSADVVHGIHVWSS